MGRKIGTGPIVNGIQLPKNPKRYKNIRCVSCSDFKIKLQHMNPIDDATGYNRRYVCYACGARWSTHERIVIRTEIRVIKRSNAEELFDKAKLRRSIELACIGCAISKERISRLVTQIEKQFDARTLTVRIKSSLIGSLVLGSLKELDGVAYLRYASLHLKFKSLHDAKVVIDDWFKSHI